MTRRMKARRNDKSKIRRNKEGTNETVNGRNKVGNDVTESERIRRSKTRKNEQVIRRRKKEGMVEKMRERNKEEA